MEKIYYEIRLPVAGFNPDALAGILQQEGTMGILEQPGGEWVAYFPADWSPEKFHELIRRLKKINPALKMELLRTERKPFQDWNREWQKHFVPFEVVQGVWIRPVWEKLPFAAEGLEIIIQPGMAFGTGHHETTRLIMSFLRGMRLAGKSVLDLGCGSGILAIMAAKLGAESVLGADIDGEALENARENAALNDITKIEFIQGSIDKVSSRRFDLILANINLNVLKNLPAALFECLKSDGKLILSGILHSDVPEIDRIYSESGFRPEKKEEAGEWAGLLYTV